MLFTKKRYAIHYQIEEFLTYRKRRVGTSKDHGKYLHQFAKITGVTNAEDISEYDIRAYIEAIQDRGRHIEEIQTAFRLFYTFAKQKEYISEYTHKTHNWDVTTKDRYGKRSIIPLQKQVDDDILDYDMRMKKRKVGQPVKTELKKSLHQLSKKGKSIRKIEQETGVPRSTVHYHLRSKVK